MDDERKRQQLDAQWRMGVFLLVVGLGCMAIISLRQPDKTMRFLRERHDVIVVALVGTLLATTTSTLLSKLYTMITRPILTWKKTQ
ncbi:MAG: hypothetical protein SGPRY_011647 [Prymnesium sp.]